MKKDEIRKYMLIRNEAKADITLYRVLTISEKILVINCQKKNMPMWITEEDAICEYPEEFHDINDYWVARVFG
ncbi:MAG: hypothetical protein H2184_13225 [Candidatus Galacturonibacter soehngenii]|nr:hypothetical protein [Candidatus Galacturonibacter soehngenii]